MQRDALGAPSARSGAVSPSGRVRASVQGEIDGARGSGQPLDGGARARLERTLGESLGALRIHADDRAASLARAVSARAFAVGIDVFFSAGLYRPGTADGDRLIAHEAVAHAAAAQCPGRRAASTVSQPGDVLEREAKAIVADLANSPAADATAATSMPAAGPPRRELARACLPATECAGPKPSLTELVQQAEGEAGDQSEGRHAQGGLRRAARRAQAMATPRRPRR